MKTGRIVLAGGSGFLGKSLAQVLVARGCEVVVLTRQPSSQGGLAREVFWDGRQLGSWTESLDGADAVINLAGRSVNCRYNEANRAEINASRVDSVRVVGEAIRRCGLAVRTKSIRGGTDGSRLSFMGLPTPNLFAGEHNFHSRLEWVSRQDMEKAVDVIVALCQVWEERSAL